MPPFYTQLPNRGEGQWILTVTAAAAPGENRCAQTVKDLLICTNV